jgi:uncharacterized protein YndB with AHSA1/START domain
MIATVAETHIGKSPDEVFGYLDDLEKTPLWNTRCVEVKQLSPGSRAIGAKLLYRYKDGGRQGEMDGEVVAYEKPRQLSMRYVDKLMSVSVAFDLTAQGSGTQLVHSVQIEPRSLLIKLMTPIIRSATRKHTDGVVATLKRLLEA